MITRLLPATDENIRTAAEVIRSGGLVAFPTETVYGLGANALDSDAISKIFTAKGRPADNPLIAHVAIIEAIKLLVSELPSSAVLLMERFMPGPLTLVLPRSPLIPDALTAGGDTVAVRVPAHDVARKLIEYAGVPIAAPSANVSGSPSPTTAAHVLNDMDGKVDIILDGGACSVGVESTVLSLVGTPRLLRPGGVTLEQLRETLSEVEIDDALYGELADGARVSSPGMKYRHYAPSVPVVAVCGAPEATANYLLSKLSDDIHAGFICFNEYSDMFPSELTVSIGVCGANDDHARGLFDALRRLDALKVDIIYAQCPDERGIGLAVSNRLKKAAGFSIINVE